MVIPLADYTWKQWEQTQDNDNLINQAACERWQAGIELAGGSWSGSFEDGKDSITIDEFNALEQQIQSKVSSYTPKNYDPDSTVQIVPGVDGWNKVEDGILKAVCDSDKNKRNYLVGTHDLTNIAGRIWTQQSKSNPSLNIDDDGFGVRTFEVSTTNRDLYLMTSIDASKDAWAGKTITLSFETFDENFASNVGGKMVNFLICGADSANTNGTRKYTGVNGNLSTRSGAEWQFNNDDFVDNEWFRVTGTYTVPSIADMTQDTETEYAFLWYGIRFYNSSNRSSDWLIRKPKLEINGEATDWIYAPEDYGWPDNTEL